jgi:hypothetical protein
MWPTTTLASTVGPTQARRKRALSSSPKFFERWELVLSDVTEWSPVAIEQPTGPPVPLAIAAFVAVACSLACFLPAQQRFHWIGYGIGALLVAVLVIAYRQVNKHRAGLGNHVDQPLWNHMALAALIAGILVAAGHAYFIALEHSVAQ